VLTMAIGAGSQYTVTPKSGGQPTTTPFPTKYSIQCTVPLAAVSGSTGAVQPASGIVTFSDGTEDEQHIVLDFKNASDNDWQIIPKPEPSGDDIQSIFLPHLANYFRESVAGVDYALATVNNKGGGTGLVLKPKQFAFATSGSLDTGTLSIYILTDVSGHDAGDASPVFSPGGATDLVPVPAGFTSSVILSYDLITSVYFKSQLETPATPDAVKYTVSVVASSEGVDLRLATNQSVIGDGSDGSYYDGSNYSYDGLDVPIDDKNPMVLTISNATYKLSWSGSTTSEWQETSPSGGGNHPSHTTYGSVKFTIKLDKGPTPFAALTDHELKLIDLSLTSKDFSVDKDGGKCSIESALGKSTQIPSYYDHMKLQAPPIDLRLAGLDFFLDTNLLAAGQQIVTIDTKTGVKTPHDFLLVGSLAAKPSAS